MLSTSNCVLNFIEIRGFKKKKYVEIMYCTVACVIIVESFFSFVLSLPNTKRGLQAAFLRPDVLE